MAITARDQGYSWVILAAATALSVLRSSGYSTFGFYYVEFLEHFQVGKTELSWIGACQAFMTGIAGLCSGPIVNTYGCRTLVTLGTVLLLAGYISSVFMYNHHVLYFTLGILAGTGFGIYQLAAIVIVQQYFDKRRSTAAGITMAGLSAGTFIWPPIVERLIQIYSWRGALLIHSGILMHGLVVGGLMRPFSESHQPQRQKDSSLDAAKSEKSARPITDPSVLKQENKTGPESKVSEPKTSSLNKWLTASGASLLKTPNFSFFCIAAFWMHIGHVGVFAFLPLRAVETGFTKQRAALLMSTLAICAGVSRFIMGVVGDKFPHHRALLSGLANILTGAVTLISAFLTQHWTLFSYAALFGTVGATYVVLFGSVVVDIVGPAEVASGVGIVSFVQSLASLALYPISGVMIDATGNAACPFFLFGATQIIAGVFYCIVQYLISRKRRSSSLQHKQKTDITKNAKERLS